MCQPQRSSSSSNSSGGIRNLDRMCFQMLTNSDMSPAYDALSMAELDERTDG